MKIKIIMVVLAALSLISCSDQAPAFEPSHQYNTEEFVESKQEEEVFFVHNPIQPYYITLEAYGLEPILKGQTVEVPFSQAQKIHSLGIWADHAYKLRVTFDHKTYTLSLVPGDNIFDIPSDTIVDTMVIEVVDGPGEGFNLENIFLQAYRQMDKEAYLNFKSQEEWVLKLKHAVIWQDNPQDNLALLPALNAQYDDALLMLYGAAVDYGLLKDGPDQWVGYPVMINGPVEDVAFADGYIVVSVRTAFTDEPIKVYFDNFDSSQERLERVGIFLGYDGYLKFYSVD